MSSRRSSSRRGGGGGGGSYYPTQWSEWEWNTQYQRYARYRLRGPDDYEYEYGQEQAENTPRTNPPLNPIAQQSPQAYTQQVSYTTAPAEGSADVDNLTRSLSQTTLGPGTGSSFPPTYTSTQSRQSGPNYITTRNPHTTSEEFDPHYKVHGGWEFKWGRVFKVLWTEPKGTDGRGSTGGSSTGATISERPGQYGETYHEKVRRFVIINAMEGHCICLPIMTYGGQGVNKRGVHAKYHTIIYTNKTAVAFKGEKEKGLTKKPIRVEPSGPRHKLDPASRLNYAKPYTVEYNVKVWFIGKVHSRSEWQLGADYNRVHPPLEPRGIPPEDGSDNGGYHGGNGSGYYPSTYSTGSSAYPSTTSYPGTTSYPNPIPSYGSNPSPYGSPLTGTGTSFSVPYPSHPSLDTVGEEYGHEDTRHSERYAQQDSRGHDAAQEERYPEADPPTETERDAPPEEDLYDE